MDVMQAIRERRSIRKYRTEPVTAEALRPILEAARWAPSWANIQCWRLIVVQDLVTKLKLSGLLRSVRPDGKNPSTEAVRNAPVVIIACAERGLSGCYRSGNKLGMPASKAGIFGLSRALAREVGEYKINVNCIAPGSTFTEEPMDQTALEFRKQAMPRRAIKRLEYPEDVAGAAIFLASSDSDFITGQTIVVDEGRIMH